MSQKSDIKEFLKNNPEQRKNLHIATEDEKPKSFKKLTDFTLAEHFVKKHKQNLKYVPLWSKWIMWTGTHWSLCEKLEPEKLAKVSVRDFYKMAAETSDDEERKSLAKFALKNEKMKAVKEILEYAKSELSISPDLLDKPLNLINLKNGTYDICKGSLKSHSQGDYITKLIDIDYSEQAKCPIFEAFLNRIFNSNHSLIKYIQTAYGYSLTGYVSEQCFFLMHGIGANGKSTLQEIVAYVAGDYAMNTPTATFMARNGDSIPNDIARLKGARLVSASETDEGKRLSESLIKNLTGGERISARFMRGEFFDYIPQFKIWIAANHKPTIRGNDLGIWRRVRLIPFEVTIPEKERDKELFKKLKAEKEGILTWLLNGASTWYKEGLSTPDEVTIAVSSYREEMDTLADFLQQKCITGGGYSVKGNELYRSYSEFCKENNLFLMSNKKLTLSMKERGFQSEIGHSKRLIWRGIGLLEEDD